MSTAVTVSVPHLGSEVDVVVNVPTRRQFQATSETDKYKVVINNYESVGATNYTVSLFDLETPFLQLRNNYKFKGCATSCHEFEGVDARAKAIDIAAKLLVGIFA